MMKKPLLFAHRGFSGQYPENSPLAFQMAVEETHVDGIESDVHISKDGELVIMHDAEVDRTSNGSGFIKDYTYEELLQLDIGSWKSPEFAGQHIWNFDQQRQNGRCDPDRQTKKAYAFFIHFPPVESVEPYPTKPFARAANKIPAPAGGWARTAFPPTR